MSEPSDLGVEEREILTFEREWWTYEGAKDEAIRARFAITSTHYYRRLNLLLDHPEAMSHDPLLVRRLRRLRVVRQHQRSARRAGLTR